MPRPLRVPLGAGGVRERRRALSGPLQPQPSPGNLCPLRKGRKNRSARREEPQAEARPRKGQRPAPRVRPRPLGPRRALGAAATHAPPATKRRGARARRLRGRGAGGGGPCGGLSRERAARRLGAEGPSAAEGHRGTLGHLPSRTVWEREASAASGGESRRWRDLPEAESPLPRPGCRGRRARERGLVCLAEGHGFPAEGSVLCFWTRAAAGAGAGHRTLGFSCPGGGAPCGLFPCRRRDLCLALGLSRRCPSSVVSCCSWRWEGRCGRA
ncbi:translation initiation factor IF-2-like [Trachypithecus francoisi]|uniref:translation initiation factor IF-2-like n=1 Tax=Trachypithecus francoisi TaxID=54180 RepID=UPI00141B6421|nr:translation initiation factor IF-2-like [Trachypithecus francoisi]